MKIALKQNNITLEFDTETGKLLGDCDEINAFIGDYPMYLFNVAVKRMETLINDMIPTITQEFGDSVPLLNIFSNNYLIFRSGKMSTIWAMCRPEYNLTVFKRMGDARLLNLLVNGE